MKRQKDINKYELFIKRAFEDTATGHVTKEVHEFKVAVPKPKEKK